jgi:DNA-binding transcriptional regulator YbjK
MKVTPYQHNANMIREYQRVIHQQHLKELEKLNRQTEEKFKAQWVRPDSVDVYV